MDRGDDEVVEIEESEETAALKNCPSPKKQKTTLLEKLLRKSLKIIIPQIIIPQLLFS